MSISETTGTVRVREIEMFERPTTFRQPFKFGAVTLRDAPQVFARVRVEDRAGNSAWGTSAEMLAPKWFDKSPDLSNDDNFNQLRLAIDLAKQAYLATPPARPFDLMAQNYDAIRAEGAKAGLNALTAGYGPALLDRAIADGFCHLNGIPFSTALRDNLLGINTQYMATDLAGFDMVRYLQSLTFRSSIQARHTVGMVDLLCGDDLPEDQRIDDGLPETLEEVIDFYGHRYFKIKIGGDPSADLDRLRNIAAILDQKCETYHISLDGNEQYEDAEGVEDLLTGLQSDPSLTNFARSILMVEQPIRREVALQNDVSRITERYPTIIDESDGEIDTFLTAKAQGYSGVSSKGCKGFYKSILNGARCTAWNLDEGGNRYFLSAEDLTCQGGVAVQQDLALISLLGISHVERNGHHYVNGLTAAPKSEQEAFLAAHPDLYVRGEDGVRIDIQAGSLSIASLDCIGFATSITPAS